MRTVRPRVFLCAYLLASSASLPAQEQTFTTRSFGVNDAQVVTIPFSRFQAWTGVSGPVTFNSVSGSVLGGYRYMTAGTPVLAAEIDAGLVPNGAELEAVYFYVRDDDAVADRDFAGLLCRNWVDLDGANPSGDCPVIIQTTGAPGDTVISAFPDLPIRYDDDVDGDAVTESVSFILLAQFGVGNEDVYGPLLRIRHVRLLFRRRVAPAPATATFLDVPTSHPFYQFIEALSASGITSGCGTGIYCPNSPLTRGQMAVFLAKALGLHWPASSTP